ncbi:MAG: peptide-binding protein [Elusimicrobia bacterium]|nr:peptide-binding protein [Elusimicrobiota bacterium]
MAWFSRVVLAVPLFVAACGRDPIPEPALVPADLGPVTGDTYVEASLGDPSRLNPLLASDSASGTVNGYLFNGLVKYDRDLKLVGDLAESWTVRQNGLEILFRLRKNVRWHDGVPFTADDVVFTYQRLIDPKVLTPYGSDFAGVQSVTAVDPHTVRVLYKEPFAPALESWGMGLIPKHVFEKGDFNTHPAHRAPIGTGPYRFQELKTDEKAVLVANADYFEGRPNIDRVVIRVIPDSSVQFLELRNQSIDSMGLRPDQYIAYDSFFQNHQKFRYPSFSYTFFGFNLQRPLFKDLRVRRALALALDKREIIDGVLLGYGRSATGPFPPSSWAYDPTVPEWPCDPVRAKTLLAEAGWRDTDGDGVLDKGGKPFAFTVITNQGNKLREQTAVIMQAHLARIGVKMEVRVLEWSSFIHDFVDKGNFDSILLGWSLGRDPDQYLIWHSSQRGEGRYNFVGYQNPAADRLWEEGRRTFDPARRRLIYHRLHRMLAEDLPYIFLYYPEALPTVHKRFHNVLLAPAGIGWNFREWFVPKSLQRYRLAS